MHKSTLKMLAVTCLLGLGFAGSANAQRTVPDMMWAITLPDAEGNDRQVMITFVENGIRVHQACTPFTAVWGQGEKVQIDYADSHVMCFVTPEYEIATAMFFANMKVYYASDSDTIILMTLDNDVVEATYVAPTPEEGQVIWR